jgi:putative endopeptidase
MMPPTDIVALFLAVALTPMIAACSSSSEEPTSTPAFDQSYLDHSADPCTDFFQYACGSWIAQHPAPAGYANQRFENGDQRDQLYYSQLVDAMSSGDVSLQAAQQYYVACLDAHSSSNVVATGLTNQLAVIAGMTHVSDLPSALATLHELGVSAIFHADTDIDPEQPARYTVTIRDGGWSLPARNSYDDASLAQAYRSHMTALALAAQTASASIQLPSQAVFDFEKAIAQSGVDDLDPVAGNVRLTNAKLSDAVPELDWGAYFTQRGYGSVKTVNLLQPDFPAALSALLSATPLSTIQAYLTWRVLESDAYEINQPLIAEELQFHRTVLNGQTDLPADDYQCLGATRDEFGFVLAQHFVENFVSSDVRPSADALATSIRSAMRANLSQVSWLDEATRAAAEDKLGLLLAKVGYPDAWPPARVGFATAASFLDDVQAEARRFANSEADQLATPVDRTTFWASPEITNAFYNPVRNDITIPVAVLQSPFFDQVRPPAFDFGALGAVIGHELTHAFDNNGRHFDGQGKLVNWWTQSVTTEFDQRTTCLVEQFDAAQPLPGLHVDGQATLGENIADLGGLKLAWSAFQSLPDRGKALASFTPEQQFFLSYAQLYCASWSEDVVRSVVATDPHAPPGDRVNGVVRNVPAFADAFSCPVGSPLAPVDRCEVW